MRRLRWALLSLGLVACIVFFGSRSPKVRELFQPSSRQEDPLEFLENLPEIKPPPQKQGGAAVGRSEASAAAPQSGFSQRPSNQVPNAQVSRVVMQILRAKGLDDGLAISVDDTEIFVSGSVATPGGKEAILEVLEKARESRRVNDEYLTVRGKSPDGS